MFQKVCVFMLIACFAGVAIARDDIQQVVTSEVFFDRSQQVQEQNVSQQTETEDVEYVEQQDVPVWPLAGSEADVEIVCGEKECLEGNKGLVIENNINTGWSGGPNIMNTMPLPAGFDYECENNVEMPLMRREMLEDDGGSVLTMSRSSRRNCKKTADSYAVFAERAGFQPEETCGGFENKPGENMGISVDNTTEVSEKEIAVNEYVDEEAPAKVQDQVRSWVVANGQTLREVLQGWCDKEGWDLVWTTSREYPIEASAVFKGRFVDVASALVRNFERATPVPYAKFYKGNRVLVISTSEE